MPSTSTSGSTERISSTWGGISNQSLTPVTVSPAAVQLGTKPAVTGSVTELKIMGISVPSAAATIVCAVGVVMAWMISGFKETK
ncbi:hypothetical protein ES703_113749 [subsurface metagenome]